METIELIIKIILVIFSLFLIVVVLLQSGKSAGLGAIAGGAEGIMGKQKARGKDAIFARLTKISAIGFMVLAIVMIVLQRFA